VLDDPRPGRRIEEAAAGVRLAEVDFGMASRTVNLTFTPETRVGDFVIVHAGFAIRTLPEDEAREALALVRELARTASTPAATAAGGGGA